MTYDVDFFIRKFEAIPEDGFCMYRFKEGDKLCVNGYCGVFEGNVKTKEVIALKALFINVRLTYLDSMGYLGQYVDDGDFYSRKSAAINDGYAKEYQQPTPKQRILAALNDVKTLQQKQQPSYLNIQKQLAILPKEETPDIIFQTVN